VWTIRGHSCLDKLSSVVLVVFSLGAATTFLHESFGCLAEIAYLCREMTKRREKQKTQSVQNKQQTTVAGKGYIPKKGYGENLIELGKLFYDLGKLVFGGDVLTILLDYRDDKTALLVVGVVVMVLCFVLGWILIARGNRIKNIV